MYGDTLPSKYRSQGFNVTLVSDGNPVGETDCYVHAPATSLYPAHQINTEISTIWHEIITKRIPWELSFVIFEGFRTLENSGEDFFKELRVKFVIFQKWLFQSNFS